MPFCGVSRFVVTGFLTGSWLYNQGQQPVWGVGRLYLSVRGIREPRVDKCNDLRLFCILKNCEVLCRTRRSSEIQPERAGVFCSALFILFAYINQWFPSFTELSPKVKVAVRAVCWTALTFCLMILWKKFSIVTVRLFSCLFVLGVFELLGMLLFDYLEVTSSIPAIVVLVIVSVFFLIWNFWPKPNADNVIEPYDDK